MALQGWAAAEDEERPGGWVPPSGTKRRRSGVSLFFLTLLMPLLLAYYALAFLIAYLTTLLVWPVTFELARRLYFACPFLPSIWASLGVVRGRMARIGFEGSYAINTLTRLFTLPMRRSLPSFYILGFPKCGTTTLAEHLKQHPAISGVDGLPYHEALRKESHFFSGILGRSNAHSAAAYRSFFPTVMRRWWAEAVCGVDKWMCFDACPVTAILPHSAARIKALTPGAKLVIMVRDPADAVFSGEIMLSNMGVNLGWTLTDPVNDERNDPRFKEDKDVESLWHDLAALGPTDPLPQNALELLYLRAAAYVKSGQFADCVVPFLQHFPRHSLLFVNFQDLVADPEGTTRRVLEFVGADPGLLRFQAVPPKMKGDYRGRKLHPEARAALNRLFADSNQRLYQITGIDFGWGDVERPASE